jgi:hypothetical protein
VYSRKRKRVGFQAFLAMRVAVREKTTPIDSKGLTSINKLISFFEKSAGRSFVLKRFSYVARRIAAACIFSGRLMELSFQ